MQVGDQVMCISHDYISLSYGKVYNINGIYEYNGIICLSIYNDKYRFDIFHKHVFKLLSDVRGELIDKLL